MPDTYVGFVDAGVLRSFQKGYFRPQGTVIVNWFRQLEKIHLAGERFLRLYWYTMANWIRLIVSTASNAGFSMR